MWAEKLEVHEGAHVLEVAVGNGYNLPFIADVIGENGRLAGLDISSNCLRVARERMLGRNIRTELVHGNATYLPYKSNVFDAVLSLGGFNNFSDKKRSLEEMHRVAKAGGKVVMEDEGLSPDRERTLLGKYILMCMKDFSSKPPLEHLPGAIEDLKLYWINQGTCWVIEFRKKG
jgi:ubiquinone/menaquinone biosynthesis C-methylase UbiE